jgi:hypothetical protein
MAIAMVYLHVIDEKSQTLACGVAEVRSFHDGELTIYFLFVPQFTDGPRYLRLPDTRWRIPEMVADVGEAELGQRIASKVMPG